MLNTNLPHHRYLNIKFCLARQALSRKCLPFLPDFYTPLVSFENPFVLIYKRVFAINSQQRLFAKNYFPRKSFPSQFFCRGLSVSVSFFVADSKHGFRCFVVLLMNLQLEQKCFCLLTMFAQRLVCSRNWRRNFATINELRIHLIKSLKDDGKGSIFLIHYQTIVRLRVLGR